ncbi:MAG TPA: peroxiredoxin [Candidatus Marinimicrobia bacterium]|nr:peroxiredoxin [Candidatus Neomarinimicrobiota bacterium]
MILGLGANLFGSDLLKVGTKAPDFTLLTETGEKVTLSKALEKGNVVLVFYPGDDTPGCTSQLCAIRDDWSEFTGKNIQVYGVNPADAESHMKFSDKYSYPFPLLIDEDKSVSVDYKTSGKFFISRSVYGIDQSGKIVFAENGKPANSLILAAFLK